RDTLYSLLMKMNVPVEEAEAAKQRAEEVERKLISLVERKLAKGQTEEQIAEDFFASVEYIRELRDKNK
ncbi:MAG: hypothetical protein LIO80_02510, partial [Lachnospiraceae bacterium]|nr:hypothetical protein [Lachnospiraceae bacterium]